MDIPIISSETPRRITPTDVAQFIRLDQCERYLRLRLHQRDGGYSFLREYDVVPQSIPPLLTRSGAEFEVEVETAVKRNHWKINYVEDVAHGGNREDDHAAVAQVLTELAPGETVFLFQPRLSSRVGAWLLRGDMDILHAHRDDTGALHLLIADMKSTTAARVEHRLQVAFYHEMLEALLAGYGVAHEPIRMAILYRGPVEIASEEDVARLEEQVRAAEDLLGEPVGYLEMVEDAESYLGAVADLVTGETSTAARIAEAPFDDLPFVLNYKCDGCMFNEFCMRSAAEHDDLSLLPYVTAEDKLALQRHGLTSIKEVAALKDLRDKELVADPSTGETIRRLAVTWPVGPRLDELVLRARRYRRWKGDTIDSLSYIPSKGHGSLPYSDAHQNPNLLRVYIDAQHDYLHDRVYMLGALVAASEGGVEARRRHVVHALEEPPDDPALERGLFLEWIRETLEAIVELAAPDEDGEPSAPIHLIFWNRFDQRVLLQGLGRHLDTILGATPLYDFVTQMAAFDSPVLTFMDGEIRELKNYPMVCQSLQAVAAYLGFDWNRDLPYRDIFRTRMFDFWRKFDWDNPQEVPWYFGRARFNSQIPLEYAYAAWGDLPAPPPGRHDDFAPYRAVTMDLLRGFHARRLDALEHVAHDFKGNQQTEKRAFHLPDLALFEEKAPTLAHALQEFITVERHVELADWKSQHLPPPERRVLAGTTLIGRYCEADQDEATVLQMRENYRRWQLKLAYEAEARAVSGETNPKLTKEQKAETKWSLTGLRIRLRLDVDGIDAGLDEMLALSSFRPGDRVVVMPRTITDSRLPTNQQAPIIPTPKRLLYGSRADITGLTVERDGSGRALAALVEVTLAGAGSSPVKGYAFSSMDVPFVDGERVTIDTDPNAWYDYFCLTAVDGLLAGERNIAYDWMRGEREPVDWPERAALAQRRFLEGLDALQQRGALHPFEPSKRDYIACHGDDQMLLVQGPPGTGKSYSTGFALFARLQGAMAAGREYRVMLTCKTHSATDVLLKNVVEVQSLLRELCAAHPDIAVHYFDCRLLDVPMFRFGAHEESIPGVTYLHRKGDRGPGDREPVAAMTATEWSVMGAAPAGTYRMLKDRYNSLYGHELIDCLVLDEASQMNLPEAVMASLAVKPGGHLIVVGDHRQMPPIVKNDWDRELRRTFKEFRAYESLFLSLVALEPPMIKFEESFRLHEDMAEFLRREIYVHDGINFHSRQHRELAPLEVADPFVASVLSTRHSLVVVVHDEAESLVENSFERRLITPVLETMVQTFDLKAEHGLGVVVPHRAQRGALAEAVPELTVVDPKTGAPMRSAVDTVERFQGDERDAIMVSATESDPQYLLLSGDFLLDPRRLTVALSRAKRKMILVASRSVFNLFSADEETFQNAQLWKNLLRFTCTELLWEGEREGHRVQVWGNVPSERIHAAAG